MNSIRLRTSLFVAALAASLLPAVPAAAQNTLGAGTLGNLFLPRNGKVAHYSSYSRTGDNDDRRPIAPGETFTLVDHKGSAGIVRRWWITIAPRNNRDIQRQLIVRCYWDGETEPSVEVPVSDFFGMGFGEWRDYQSLPLNMTSGGYNCYWPMPFHKSARITVENRSKVKVDSFYYNVDIETHDKLPKDSLYFHAQFRRVRTVNGKPVTLLETTGRGQYVGTLLSMQSLKARGLGFLEGDEQVYVDGEKTPSIIGTGTEDYFSSGWYYDTGVYSALYHGVTIKDDRPGRINTYRWHIEDPIPFTKSLKFDIEHGGVNDAPDTDYSSVAFWYQTHPHPKFPPLPADLLPAEIPPIPRIPGMIEGERLIRGAKATSGNVIVQDMGVWTGLWSDLRQLWWQPQKEGERLTLTLNAPEAKEYELVGYFTRARDYGDVQVLVNGKPLSPIVTGYSADVVPTGPISLGRVYLNAGANEVVLELTGKDARSTGYYIGLDGWVLKP